MMLTTSQRVPGVQVLVICIAASAVDIGGAQVQNSPIPDKAAILAGAKGLWCATQEGASWEKRIPPGTGYIESLTTEPRGQGHVLMCRGGVVWMSQNRGHSWGSPLFGTSKEQAVAAAFHPRRPNTLFLATNRRLLISTTAGKDWAPPTPGLTFRWRPRSVLVSGKEPDRIYITTRGEGMFRSNDGGQTWNSINADLPKGIGAAPVAPVESAVLDPADPGVVYVAVEARGVYKTTNGGGTWVRVSKGLPDLIMYATSPWVLAIDPSNPRRLLVWASWPVHSERVDTAFFLSEDAAANWREITASPDGRVFGVQFVDAKLGLAVAITEHGAMFLSN